MTETIEHLTRLGACAEGKKWIALPENASKTPAQLWDACHRGDWLLWLAYHQSVDLMLMTLAACDCARLALPFVPAGDDRPRLCIETAEAYTRGEATMDDMRIAALASLAAIDPPVCAIREVYAAYAADSGAYAAGAAFAAVAYACAFNSEDIVLFRGSDTFADSAAGAANAAECNVFAIVGTRFSGAAYLGAIAQRKTLAECADLVRARIPWSVVETALELKGIEP